MELWRFNSNTRRAERLDSTPTGLADDYMTVGHSDESFDPFSLTIRLPAKPWLKNDWIADLNFDRQTFSLQVPADDAETAVAALERVYNSVILETRSTTTNGDRVVIDGTIRARPATN